MSTDRTTEVARRVHELLLDQPEPAASPAAVAALARDVDPLLGAGSIGATVAQVLSIVGGLGPLDPVLADPAVTDVMVNGPGPVWVERRGELERTDVRLDAATLAHLIERIVGPLGARIDRSSPMVDARLPDGSRVNAVIAPLALDGSYLTIRRFGARSVPLDAFADPAVVELLVGLVRARCNLLVSGATGAGKTTLLNALAAHCDAAERIITIEDAAELRLPGEHVVRLESRRASADGVGAVSVRELVRNALRMRPDRIVVGEVRGGEAFDMLQALNTGHDGSLSTCHANGCADALGRIETMVLLAESGLPLDAVRAQLDSALDVVIHVGRAPGGARRVVEVSELTRSVPRLRRLADATTVSAAPLRSRAPDGGHAAGTS